MHIFPSKVTIFVAFEYDWCLVKSVLTKSCLVKSVNVDLRILKLIFLQKFELTKRKISNLPEVNKN